MIKGFVPLDYLIFVVYLVLSVAIGVFFVKDQKTVEDYFLASRSMGYVPVAISIIAALFSGISYLGAPAEVYNNDLGFSLNMLSFFIATPVTATVFLPFFYRLKLYSAYEYLERRFSIEVRVLSSMVFILRVLLWLALATYAPALALSAVTGIPLWVTIIVTGALSAIYTAMGGMKAVIWTDVFQFIVLFGGIIVIIVAALAKIPGGLGGVMEIAEAGGKFRMFNFTIDPTARASVWALVFGGAAVNLVQMATDQMSVQRYMTATDLREAKRSLWLKLALTVPVVALFYFSGVVLYAFYRQYGDPLASHAISKADQILPYFVVTELPSGVPGVMIAAIYAATMSTTSSGINALTTATIVDFCQRVFGLQASEKRLLRFAQVITLFYGVLVVLLAFIVERLGSLLEASIMILGLVGGPLLGVFLLGMLTRRTNTRGALIGWGLGIGVMLVVGLGKTIGPALPEWIGGAVISAAKISFLWYGLLGAVVTIALGYLASLLFPHPSEAQIRGLVVDESAYP